MDDGNGGMKRSTEVASGRGEKKGRKRATQRDLCPARLAMCVHTLVSSASLFRLDEQRLKILEYETERERDIKGRLRGQKVEILFFSILPQREMRELILRGLHQFSPLYLSIFQYLCRLIFRLLPPDLCFSSLSIVTCVFLCTLLLTIIHIYTSSFCPPYPPFVEFHPSDSLQGLWVYDAW